MDGIGSGEETRAWPLERPKVLQSSAIRDKSGRVDDHETSGLWLVRGVCAGVRGREPAGVGATLIS
jgi:hypothetical protein